MTDLKHRQSSFSFRLMAFGFYLRDRLHPPVRILREAGVRSGMAILDFGCDPGGFSLAAARLAGPQGVVYAVDIHPLALKSIRAGAGKQGFKTMHTISGDSMADVPDRNVDMVLLYDVLHDLSEPHPILMEFRRILKPDGMLSVSDHHMKEHSLLSAITGGGLFIHAGTTRWTYQFVKAGMEAESGGL